MDRLCSLGDAIAQELQPPVPLPGTGARAAIRGGGALGEHARGEDALARRASQKSESLYIYCTKSRYTVYLNPKP